MEDAVKTPLAIQAWRHLQRAADLAGSLGTFLQGCLVEEL
ncbi:hypothetical protein NC652_034132 [Populus alba x Populus x berolinensis]|nr:hypothetical protein NC652_034132 [Populus alba x Populus x berolinensis]KAJ6925299.1 hypothetical protein NC651_009838 [Populus alba x Populus x berolinensis]KAJ6925803.1 hypothetical protein NC651_010284 [Populus alba x Populus x berolinensis]